jgi:hypothetical protein
MWAPRAEIGMGRANYAFAPAPPPQWIFEKNQNWRNKYTFLITIWSVFKTLYSPVPNGSKMMCGQIFRWVGGLIWIVIMDSKDTNWLQNVIHDLFYWRVKLLLFNLREVLWLRTRCKSETNHKVLRDKVNKKLERLTSITQSYHLFFQWFRFCKKYREN